MNIENYISSGIIEQYVLGLCSQEEITEVESLRKSNSTFNEAVIAFEILFEQKMLNEANSTTNETDTKILQKLQSLGNNPLTAIKPQQVKTNTFNFIKFLAAASVALLVISAFYNFSLFSKNKQQEDRIASIVKEQAASLPVTDYAILKNPRITPVGMYGVGTHVICRCTMFWDKATGKAYVMIHHLVPSKAGKDYQLWATVNGKQVSVGIVNDKIRDRFIEVAGVPEDANAFMVTLENDGGASTPTLNETYLMGKI